MTAAALVLLHSPLVGPLTWHAVAERLRAHGRHVQVPSLSAALAAGPPFYPALARTVHDALRHVVGGQAVLAVHSGAGPLVPSIVEGAPVEVTAVVFVDAALPHPGQSWFDTAPREMADKLRQLAVNGVLPPWNDWFPPEVLSALLPEPGLRTEFTADVPRLPLAYFEEVAPDSQRWRQTRCGYLQLSEIYDQPAAEAGRRGWRVVRHQGHHLSLLTEPAIISDQLSALVNPG